MKSIKLNGTECFPSKIICVGRNYVEHIEELNNEMPTEPVVFIKPNSAISSEIIFHQEVEIHYEAEISFLIRNKKLSAVAIGLDLTKRQVQTRLKEKSLPWERAKAFDGSAVLSAFVYFDGDVSQLKMELFINGELKQLATYALMLNKPNDLLQDVQSFLSLEDNDILMTGTPKGVGRIHQGDRFVGKIYEKDKLIIEYAWIVK